MSKLRVHGSRQLGVLLLLLALPLAASPPPPTSPTPASDGAAAPAVAATGDPSALPSELMPRAGRSLLLDVTRSSAGFFAVGERGHVLRSADGKTWTQVQTPTRSALTTVTAVDGHVWAAGHDGVIIHSADGGETWTAQRRDPLSAGDAFDREPSQGAPILDIHFSDASTGIAVGAYSLMLLTTDGGATWTPKRAVEASGAEPEQAAPMEGDIFSQEDLMLDEETNPHFNAIVEAGPRTLVVVGERGTLLRSTDAGGSWQKLAFPYKGSMFGVLHLGASRLLAHGLRGNVYESGDAGSSWRKVAAQGSTSLMGGAALSGGGAVLVGANGAVLMRAVAASPFSLVVYKNVDGESPALSSIVPVGDGTYVLVGDKGVELANLQ